MCPQSPFDDEFDDECPWLLLRFGWHEDPSTRTESSVTWFPPDYLPVAGITIRRRRGYSRWETLDFQSVELVDVGPESLLEYLALRQPDVDVKRK